MPDQIKKLWLHDQDYLITILPYTTLDCIKMANQSDSFQDDYTSFKSNFSNLQTYVNNIDLNPTPPMASSSSLGGVKIDGNTISIDSNGFINTVLPDATRNSKGVVQVGARLSINDGVLSADLQTIPVDSALSSSSENPVQNKVIYSALQNISAAIDLDLTSTAAILALFSDADVAYYMGDNYSL